MNRRSLVVPVLAVSILAACRPKPWREQARGMAAFGKSLLHAVPATPPPAVTPSPVAIDHRIDLTADADPKPAPTPAPTPAPKAKQPSPSKRPPGVATPRPSRPAPTAMFAAHARTQAGKSSCSAHPTMEQCTSHCTSVLRTSSLDRSPSAVRSCNCVESGC